MTKRWRHIIGGADAINLVDPEPDSKVVTIQQSADKILADIKRVQSELAALASERADVARQWKEAEAERDQIAAAHDSRERDIMERMGQLQGRFSQLAAEAGLELHVTPRRRG